MTTTGFGDIHPQRAPAPAAVRGGPDAVGHGRPGHPVRADHRRPDQRPAGRVIGAAIPRGLHDHVIVCGLGNIGYRMVEQLHGPGGAAGRGRAGRAQPLPAGGAPPGRARAGGRHPPARDLQILQVQRARSVVVVTSSDIVNLETALNTQTLRPKVRVVLRLFDLDLAARVERAFGIHISRSPSALAAPAPVAAAAGEHVLTTIAVGAEVLAVVRLRVAPAAGSRATPWPSWRAPPAAASCCSTAPPPPAGAPRVDLPEADAELVAVMPGDELGRVLALDRGGRYPTSGIWSLKVSTRAAGSTSNRRSRSASRSGSTFSGSSCSAWWSGRRRRGSGSARRSALWGCSSGLLLQVVEEAAEEAVDLVGGLHGGVAGVGQHLDPAAGAQRLGLGGRGGPGPGSPRRPGRGRSGGPGRRPARWSGGPTGMAALTWRRAASTPSRRL